MELELTRTGAFTLAGAAARNEGRCGSVSNISFTYELKIVIGQDQLSREGFVLDHNEIEKYFTDTYERGKEPFVLSCEFIAMRAVKHFHHQIYQTEDRFPIRIECGIVAAGVYHKATWDTGKHDNLIEMPSSNSPYLKSWGVPSEAA